jgi:GDP-L-fucose synthase
VTNSSRIFVAGHRGLVGSALHRRLRAGGHSNLITRERSSLDLTNADAVRAFFREERPEYVFLAAAKVGGIVANNSYPVEFIRDNLLIMVNVIEASHSHGVTKLMVLGSSCVYPKFAEQPIRESALLTGALEPTNQWYAVAKIAGIKTAQAYRQQYGLDAISVMPTNTYGPGDHFDPLTSHVVPALILKIHQAKVDGLDEAIVWGTGTPRREFLYVDDLADACIFLMQSYSGEEIVNAGFGSDITIRELVAMICDVVGFRGAIKFDSAKPDGTPRKLMDSSRITSMGWRPTVDLRSGLERTYAWFLENRIPHSSAENVRSIAVASGGR